MIARVRDILVVANLAALLVVSGLAVWHLAIVINREKVASIRVRRHTPPC